MSKKIQEEMLKKHHHAQDGGYSDNLPVLDSQTITVSPFYGAADICPQNRDFEDAIRVTKMIVLC